MLAKLFNIKLTAFQKRMDERIVKMIEEVKKLRVKSSVKQVSAHCILQAQVVFIFLFFCGVGEIDEQTIGKSL